MVVPFVQRTPATATLSLIAIVLPFKRSLFGDVALIVACMFAMHKMIGQRCPDALRSLYLYRPYHCGPPAFVVILWDMDICSWVLAQVWSREQFLIVAQLSYDVVKSTQQGSVLLDVPTVELQARL